jgi:hypothetical protein
LEIWREREIRGRCLDRRLSLQFSGSSAPFWSLHKIGVIVAGSGPLGTTESETRGHSTTSSRTKEAGLQGGFVPGLLASVYRAFCQTKA